MTPSDFQRIQLALRQDVLKWRLDKLAAQLAWLSIPKNKQWLNLRWLKGEKEMRSSWKGERYYCSPLCGGWIRSHRPIKHGIIWGIDDLRDYLGADSYQGMNHRIYKDTDCGASISVQTWDGEWYHNGQDWSGVSTLRAFTIQTIVEGSDATVDSGVFTVPCKAREVTQWIAEMERESKSLWDEANNECKEN
jgi:hypothetical protein